MENRPDVDSGWAWLVFVAVIIWEVIMAGTMKSFGILYVEFLRVYDRSASETSWISSTSLLMITLLSPVAGAISDSFPTRPIIIILGLVSSLTIFITGQMPSLELVILTYGAILGACCGLMDAPILRATGVYFRRRRVLVSTVSFACGSFAFMILPPILIACLDQYGFQGTFIILAGIWLHICLVGAILKPMTDFEAARSFRKKRLLSKFANQIVLASDCSTAINNNNCKMGDFDAKNKTAAQNLVMLLGSNGFETESDRTNHITSSCTDLQSATKSGFCTMDLAPKGLINSQITDQPYVNTVSTSKLVSDCDWSAYQTIAGLKTNQPDLLPANDAADRLAEIQCSPGALPYNSYSVAALENGNKNTYETSRQTFAKNKNQSEKPGSDVITSQSTTTIESLLGRRPSRLARMRRTSSAAVINYVTFLKNRRLWLLLASLSVTAFSYYNLLYFVPSLAIELGQSNYESSLCISITGGTEALSRLLVGWLITSHPLVDSNIVVLSGNLAVSLIGFGTTFLVHRSAYLLQAYAAVLGTFGGTIVALAVPMLSEVVSKDHIGSSLGLFSMSLGIGASVGAPIFAFVKEQSGTYNNSIRLGCFGYLLSTVFLIANTDIVGRLRIFISRKRRKIYPTIG